MPTRPTPSQPFEVRKSSIQGKGAFATRRIRAGQRIIEYTGDRISPEEGDRRYAEDGMGRHHTFLFTVDDETCIDGKKGGNDSRYINHSCDPNCEAVIEHGHIFIFAKRTIPDDGELTYDYQYERTDAHTKADEEFYRCLCGSPKCRGTILAPPKRKRAAKKAGAKAAKKGGTKATKATRRPRRRRRRRSGHARDEDVDGPEGLRREASAVGRPLTAR